MQTKFENYDAVELLEKVENDLGIELNTSCQRTEFQLPKQIGEGIVSTYLFRDGLSFFMFNGTLRHDWEWKFECEEDSPLVVFFALSGAIEDAEIGSEQDNFTLTLMVVQPGGIGRSAIFKKGKAINVGILRIDHKKFFDKKACSPSELPEQMRMILSMSGEVVRCLLPAGRLTPDVVKIFKEIQNCQYTGLIRTCYTEAKIREWLALLMQQLATKCQEPDTGGHSASIDLEKMEEARDFLIGNLKNPPTIKSLSRLVGLNQQALKKAFKAVFGKTIYQYLLAERMDVSKDLILNRDISIFDVALAVGYANGDHFSKRFKERFGMLPSKYRNMVRREGQDN